MTIALFAGSFDPITNGHMDVLKSGSEIFEKVVIAVSFNPEKQGFLPVETRIELIKSCTKEFNNVEVVSYEGFTVDYAKKIGAKVLLRGLRNALDFEYELQLSQTNSALNSNIKTMFLITKPENSFITSSAVREILANNGDISKFVPKEVCEYFLK